MRFVEVEKAYGEVPVLRRFSAEIGAGEVHCVMGPSGCGKTTFLRLALGLEQADAGRIEGADGLRRAAVFQEDRLCENLSAEVNICLPHIRAARERGRRGSCEELRIEIKRLLRLLGMEGTADKPVHDFSGGMKRRVALLRAVLAPSDLIVFDEPLKGLDADTKQRVMDVVAPRLAGKTALWVTHDIADLAFFDAPHAWRMTPSALEPLDGGESAPGGAVAVKTGERTA